MRTDATSTDTEGPGAEGPGAEDPGAEDPAAKSTARPGRHISPIRVVRRPAAAAALIAGLLLVGVGAAGFAVASRTGHPATPVTPVSRVSFAPIPKGKWAAVPAAVSQAVAEPVSLVIPAIGVSTRLIQLGVTPSGALQVPKSTTVAGWYTGSPRPGEPGGAVIAGHVDSVQGPAVFFRLQLLKPGEKVYVRRADGTLAVFTVTSVDSYPKSGFPTTAVYGPTPNAQLRLITCGGTFDPATGHYLSNTIAYASLAS
ncbi:MAG TPA: class F sortase [Streptosporangiaceae bacterium]|nr:class F sortase [Streptosporangiaceae bacterium]